MRFPILAFGGEISNIGFWDEISNIGFWVRFQILTFGWDFQILAFGFQVMIIQIILLANDPYFSNAPLPGALPLHFHIDLHSTPLTLMKV
jgi:hypothetical protein